MKTPILSDMQYPHHRDKNGPIPLPFMIGKFDSIITQLKWRLFDFCRIHQIVCKEINEINVKLNSIPAEKMAYDSDETFEDLQKIRLRQAVMDQDIENARVSSFVDHMTVVGLWAISEQFMAKIYRRLVSEQEGLREEDVKTPYRWDEFKKEFEVRGIILESCDNYVNANECRALNNSIKHDPTVGSTLISFSYFTPYANQQLEKVPLEMQRYLNGVSDFLGSLAEKSHEILNA